MSQISPRKQRPSLDRTHALPPKMSGDFRAILYERKISAMEEEQELHITFLDDDDKYEKGDIICVSYFPRLLLYAWTHNPLGSPLALRLFDALPDPRAPIFCCNISPVQPLF